MAKFNVRVYESRCTDVEIEADSSDEAWEIAVWKYDNGELFDGQFTDATTVDMTVAYLNVKEN